MVTPHCSDLETLGVKYVIRLVRHSSYSSDTVCKYVSTLTNFIAFAQQAEPEIVAARLLSEISERTSRGADDVIESVFGTLTSDTAPSGATREQIERLIQYLRRSHFASRTHAFVETALATKGRLEQVRTIRTTDYDRDRLVLRIETSDRFLAGSENLVPTRDVEIPEQTAQVLNEYLDHERVPLSEEGSQPLFTTARGAVSRTTIWRGLKETSESLHDVGQTAGEQAAADEDDGTIGPKDIWWYSLSEVLN
jgi:integrase